MRNRQPAEQHTEAYFTPGLGSLVRSPAERLEPTRPARFSRRRRSDMEPHGSNPFLRFLNGLFSFVLLLMVLAGGIAYLFDAQIDARGPLGRSKSVVIPKGESSQEIAWRLEREGVVSDRRLFIAGYYWLKFAAWLENARPVQLKAGDYEMQQSASVREVVNILSEGRTISYKVTIPEGLTSYQIVERLKADPNLDGEIAAVPPEGALLPETFVLKRGGQRQAIIDTMQAESHKLMERLWATRKKDLPLKSWEEAIILASIVEKETARQDERDRVAAVFVNRLRQNMRLQSDPTILYGLANGKVVWARPILKSEITQKTSHNTYQLDGLPPTPICNPGRAAIEAVLNPANTKDLYFVADGSGGHVFSETLKDHAINVHKWRAAEKEMRAKTAPTAGDTPTTGQSTPHTRAVVRKAPPKKAIDKGNASTTDAQASAPASSAQEVLPWSAGGEAKR